MGLWSTMTPRGMPTTALKFHTNRPDNGQMRRFKSARQAQLLLSVHGVVLNLFRVGRHRLTSEPIRYGRKSLRLP